MSGHALHFSLEFAGRDWRLPLICDQLRFSEIIFDLSFQLRFRHNRREWWFLLWIVFRPDAVTPVNFLNRSLIRYALCKRQSALGKIFRLRYADGSDCDSKCYCEEKSTHISNGN
jgi:hypothetical protein